MRARSALLLSALVFPGAGQYFLGHRLRALAFLIPSLTATWYLFRQAYVHALSIAEEIAQGRIDMSPLPILARIHEHGQTVSLASNLAGAVLIGCWIGALLDTWYLGRRADITPSA